MSKKLTKRKSFSFHRSYFDVINELENDSDKLDFIMAILNKQFLNEDPQGLSFIPNLCYESQRHSIETSVKGWERAMNEVLGLPIGTTPPTPLGTTPPTPKQEEEEEEKGKEEEKEYIIDSYSFEDFWEQYGKKTDRKKCEAKFSKLSNEDKEKIKGNVLAYVESTPEIQYRKNPMTYLNGECWNNEITTKGSDYSHLPKHMRPDRKPMDNLTF